MGSEAETELSRWSELSEEERVETFRRMAPRQADSLFLELSSRDELEILLALLACLPGFSPLPRLLHAYPIGGFRQEL